MHNRQIMFYRKQSVEESSENMPALSKGSNPKWSRKSHLDRLSPVPKGISCFIWKSARVRTGRPSPGRLLPVSPWGSVRGRAASAVRVRDTQTKRGPPFGGPLGDLEAKPGFEPGVKALQASALPLGHFAEKGPPKRSGNAMERTTGLEPATPTLARLCSTN